MTVEQVVEKLGGGKRTGDGQWMCRCPAHHDREASLSVGEGEKGVVLNCKAGCPTAKVLEAVGLTFGDLFRENGKGNGTHAGGRNRQIVCTYPYVDEDGNFLYEVVRYNPKKFSQRRKYQGNWVYGRKAGFYRQSKNGDWYYVGRDEKDKDLALKKEPDAIIQPFLEQKGVLYNLPKVIERCKDGKIVVLVEGEKDADNLNALGFVATTTPMGAASWHRGYAKTLGALKAKVVICPDNDAAGLQYLHRAYEQLIEEGCDVACLALPGLKEHGDVSDWIAAGGTPEEFVELLRAAWRDRRNPNHIPPKPAEKPEEPPKKEPELLDVGEEKPMLAEEAKAILLTDVANAGRLLSAFGQDMRHSSTHGWLVWDGRRWERNEKSARRNAQTIGPAVRKELFDRGIVDFKMAAEFYKHAKASSSAKGIDAMLKEAAVLAGIDADAIQWDADPWLLNCPNGTVDLRTGELRPHRRDDHITKLCPTPYNPDADCPRWMRFLEEIFCGDHELVSYWQWVIGYALTGSVEHDLFFVLYGEGSNGKTTTLETVKAVLGGEYACQLDPEAIMQQKHSQHPTALARLKGMRFVATIETGEGRRLNEALIKALTGGDTVTTRLMHKDYFDFQPELKLFLGTNHRPVIRDNSAGMWRRIRLLPFEATFEGKAKDPKLKDKLIEEAEGILAWAVDGARNAGNEPEAPSRVLAATEEYRQDQDLLGQFLEEECELLKEAFVSKRALYAAWQAFTGNRGGSHKDFSKRLQARGFEEYRTGSERRWKGIRLRDRDTGGGGYYDPN